MEILWFCIKGDRSPFGSEWFASETAGPSFFSVEALGLFSSGSNNYSDAQLTDKGYQLSLGFPIRLYQRGDDWFQWRVSVSPNLNWTQASYVAADHSPGSWSQAVNYSQIGYGASAVFTIFNRTDYGNLGYFADVRMGVSQYQDTRGLRGEVVMPLGLSGGLTW